MMKQVETLVKILFEYECEYILCIWSSTMSWKAALCADAGVHWEVPIDTSARRSVDDVDRV